MKSEKIKQERQLQKENARLKKLVAELLLEKSMLEEALQGDYGPKVLRPLTAQSEN